MAFRKGYGKVRQVVWGSSADWAWSEVLTSSLATANLSKFGGSNSSMKICGFVITVALAGLHSRAAVPPSGAIWEPIRFGNLAHRAKGAQCGPVNLRYKSLASCNRANPMA